MECPKCKKMMEIIWDNPTPTHYKLGYSCKNCKIMSVDPEDKAETPPDSAGDPGSESKLDKKGWFKKINAEPIKDVILAILRHPPKDDKDCAEQQSSVRYALAAHNIKESIKELAGKIAKVFIVSFITAMIIAIAPDLPGILSEITQILIKYNLIVP